MYGCVGGSIGVCVCVILHVMVYVCLLEGACVLDRTWVCVFVYSNKCERL